MSNMDRLGSFTQQKQARYLGALRQGLRRSKAARVANVSRETIRQHLKNDKAFAERVAEAEEDACDVIEDVLWQKALTGHFPSIKLWLENRSPDRWKDRRAVEQEVVSEPVPSLEDMRQELEQLLANESSGIIPA